MAPELERRTRRQRIDPRLRVAEWKVLGFDPAMPVSAYGQAAVEEFGTANGPADYVLCSDGRALGVVEAKKVTLGAQGVLVQAERYSRGINAVYRLVMRPAAGTSCQDARPMVLVDVGVDDRDPSPDGQGQRWLLVRRNRKTGEPAFYHCWTPRPVSLTTLVRVARQRWRIEERFQTAKGLVGLDQHQVRRWRSWYRWTTLAMVAHAFLVVAALTEQTRHPPPCGLIRLTCNEVQRRFATLHTRPAGDLGHRLRWSLWRR